MNAAASRRWIAPVTSHKLLILRGLVLVAPAVLPPAVWVAPTLPRTMNADASRR